MSCYVHALDANNNDEFNNLNNNINNNISINNHNSYTNFNDYNYKNNFATSSSGPTSSMSFLSNKLINDSYEYNRSTYSSFNQRHHSPSLTKLNNYDFNHSQSFTKSTSNLNNKLLDKEQKRRYFLFNEN